MKTVTKMDRLFLVETKVKLDPKLLLRGVLKRAVDFRKDLDAHKTHYEDGIEPFAVTRREIVKQVPKKKFVLFGESRLKNVVVGYRYFMNFDRQLNASEKSFWICSFVGAMTA